VVAVWVAFGGVRVVAPVDGAAGMDDGMRRRVDDLALERL